MHHELQREEAGGEIEHGVAGQTRPVGRARGELLVTRRASAHFALVEETSAEQGGSRAGIVGCFRMDVGDDKAARESSVGERRIGRVRTERQRDGAVSWPNLPSKQAWPE